MFNILVINCGSSSLKFQVIEIESKEVLAKGLCERIGIEGSLISCENLKDGKDKITNVTPIPDHKVAVKLCLDMLTDPENGALKSLDEINAVGHRLVHGGEKFSGSVVVTQDVIDTMDELSVLAPLHNPANLAGVNACRELMPGIPMAGVFDTAFHQTMPPKAYLYALPLKFYKEQMVRRYGFHGASHMFVSREVAKYLNTDPSRLKTIVCHLGNGSSITAVQFGKSVDTSMGFTPMPGVPMGTRCGDIDAAIIGYLMHKNGYTIDEVDQIMNKKSGVYALSGEVSSDFRDLWDAMDNGNKDAENALEAFSYAVAKQVGAYAAAMNGVDVICFTAGIGENDIRTREKIMSYFGYLGVTLDKEKNNVRGKIQEISTADSKVRCFVFPTNEELAIAEETYRLVH